MKVHDAVARTIADHGVRTLFGLMGDANMLYITDFITRHQGRFVPAADERNSVLMAGGYAAAGDVIGVATVTHGPALTNAVTPLVEVTRGRLPVVLVTGDTPANRDHLQRIGVVRGSPSLLGRLRFGQGNGATWRARAGGHNPETPLGAVLSGSRSG